ncbi:uncharacterized protein LOC116205332 [Punica granatum]|uniref:Uncharacterized protein n=2 Tax=Punica granatum TaxID=22663 RepID=A0A2I0L0Y2_PUNGR|nr:uncharacterized protein LOC116205332 [Punica granatum]PKI74371.1 hypothetical protein CRG98_005251 [Punica granatum]
MALTAAFQERLEQMDRARSQRLSLLQAEKELQASKSQVLETKHASIRSVEQRCLMLEQKIASQNLKISILKSEIDSLDAKYSSNLQQLRALKSEVEELEELEKERDRFYGEKTHKMEEFNHTVSEFIAQCRVRTEERRDDLNKLLLNSVKPQGPNRWYNGFEVAAAEKQKHELLVKKENLDRELAYNQQTRAKLQKIT